MIEAMNPADLLQELVHIPSESGQEDAIVTRLEQVFSSLGWSAVRNGRNLHAFLGDGGPMLLLNSHTDTVPVGENWTQPALGAAADGKIYGRGSNDAKGCLTAMILGAASAFGDRAPRGRVCVAATCEEEINGQGLAKLISELPKPDAAVVGEPTGLQPAVAQKGLIVLEITAKGRSAHVAWGEGVNAIEIAAKDVLALSKLKFERSHSVLGKTTLSVAQIQGGTRHNVVPDRCKIVVDIRTTPSYSPEEVIEQVKKAVKGDVVVRSQRLQAVATDEAHPIVQAALAANPGAKPWGSPGLSDWVFLKGIPTVKVGPGDSRRSHTPDEYLEIKELEAGVAFYERLIRSYFELAAT